MAQENDGLEIITMQEFLETQAGETAIGLKRRRLQLWCAWLHFIPGAAFAGASHDFPRRQYGFDFENIVASQAVSS